MKLFSIVFTLLLLPGLNQLSAQNYDTEILHVERYSDTIKRTGKLDYRRTISLSFKSSGYLTLLNVEEGQQFSKGQLLASLDITELQEAKNSLYAQLMQAKREVKRMTQLIENKLASERELDNAITQVETIRSAYQVAYYNLDKAQIYAPFTGVVLARKAELGELQSPGKEVLEIAKLEWVVKVELTGQEVSQIKLNQKVTVALNNIGTVEGVISKIPATANGISNLFTIEVLLPKIDSTSTMVAGQLAAVSIYFDSESFVYRLPISALVGVDEQGQAIVVSQTQQASDYSQNNYEIMKLGNDFVYLKADENDSSLRIITTGWQDYSQGGH